MDIADDVTFQYIFRIGYHSNELTCCIVGHLLIEYLMNRILEVKFFPKEVNLDNLTFFRKSAFLYKKGLIPPHIYKNIIHLNKIRNRYAHDINAKVRSEEFLYYKDNKWMDLYKKSKGNNNKYIRVLVDGILVELRNYLIVNLKIQPNFK